MYYVVDKYRILVESESPVNMSDYPNCQLIQGEKGVSLINFEIYEEKGQKRVRTIERDSVELKIEVLNLEPVGDNMYEVKAGSNPIEIKATMKGDPYLPPILKLPNDYDKSKIEISCSRGKLSTRELNKDCNIVKWTPVDENIDVVLVFGVLNFPPIQKVLTIRLI